MLSDGRPGHYNQSKGVIKALSFIRPVQTDWVEVRLRAGFLRILQREMLKRMHSAISPATLGIFYSFMLPDKIPDMIVSSGGRTSFANAWLARYFDIPGIFIGSLRGLPAEIFTAVLTLEPLADADNNIVLQFPVSEIDSDYLNNIAVPDRLLSKRCWTVLVGGDGSGYRYQSEDWIRLAKLLGRLAGYYGINWLVCTTPRTGKEAQQLIEQRLDKAYIADVSWYEKSQDNRLPLYLSAAEKIFVTEDSMTMIGEALGAGKPLFSLRPGMSLPNEPYRNALQRYVSRGLLSQQTIAELERNPEVIQAAEFRQLPESPLLTLSRQLEDFGLAGC